jgi:TM2 domain-containing membrane protein YozV
VNQYGYQPYGYQPPVPIGQASVEQRTAYAENLLAASSRKPAPAYLLDIFFGTLGLHRFYLHRNGSGLAMLLITLLTLGFGLLVTFVWAIVDLFLIPGIVREENERLRAETYAKFGLMPGQVIPQGPPPPPGIEGPPRGDPPTAPGQPWYEQGR